nr:MAG TPA: hypothetical protein [Caudoviricetes sp.]
MRERFWSLAFSLALGVSEFCERRMMAVVRSRK